MLKCNTHFDRTLFCYPSHLFTKARVFLKLVWKSRFYISGKDATYIYVVKPAHSSKSRLSQKKKKNKKN